MQLTGAKRHFHRSFPLYFSLHAGMKASSIFCNSNTTKCKDLCGNEIKRLGLAYMKKNYQEMQLSHGHQVC